VVILNPNTDLGCRHRGPGSDDAHGMPAAGPLGVLVGPWPGYLRERGDGGWLLGLDPLAGPVREHDVVVEPDTGRTWLVLTADYLANPAAPIVNWWRVDAREQVTGGAEPGGPQFAAGAEW
jgi:hypothetical protein